MNDLIISNNESLTMSSIEIAKLTGKEKKTVHRDIKSMCEQLYSDGTDLYHASNFGVTQKHDARGYCEVIYLDRKHTDCLLTGYSVKARMKVIERWHELECKPTHQIPQTLSQALMLAAAQAERIELQSEALKLAEPKVKFVDSFVDSKGNKTFREVAKLLSANEREFRQFLVESRIMYRLSRNWAAYGNHIDAGRFSVNTGEKNGHAYTECRFTPKGIEYVAGKWVTRKRVSKE